MIGGLQVALRGTPRPVTAGRIKRLARQAELASGTGATGYTLLRMTAKPLARLVDAGKIGPEELQAAQDITTAYFAMAGALMFRPHRMERTDPSRDGYEPTAVVDAQRRYRAWADHWSLMRRRHGDRTLEAVIAAVIDERPLWMIDREIERRDGTAAKAVARGLRDYAARAGWAGRMAEQWLAEAGTTWRRRIRTAT